MSPASGARVSSGASGEIHVISPFNHFWKSYKDSPPEKGFDTGPSWYAKFVAERLVVVRVNSMLWRLGKEYLHWIIWIDQGMAPSIVPTNSRTCDVATGSLADHQLQKRIRTCSLLAPFFCNFLEYGPALVFPTSVFC